VKTVYTVYIDDKQKMTMSEPTIKEPAIKEPAKKAFHFPKAADNAPTEKKKVVKAAKKASVEKAPVKKAAAKKAPVEKKKAVASTLPAESTPSVESTPTTEAPKKSATVKKASKAQSGPSIRTKPAQSNPAVKAKRAKKDKVIRDSFTMPKADYEKIAALKLKCQEAGVSVKKSELLRAGLLMLEAASSKRLLAAVSAVEQVKTGRPAKS
jgi:hypothetical protein